MAISFVRIIMNSFTCTAFGIGIILNGIMIHLIVRHTPKIMRNYSKILLQTCATDVAFLTLTFFFHSYTYTFTTNKGESEIILEGLLVKSTGSAAEHQAWFLFAQTFWIFFLYVSLFGYVSQFIYRYLLLNWNKQLSTIQYFFLFITILIFPFLHCVGFYVCYHPPDDHRFLEDQSVANILGLDVTDHIALTGYSYNDWKQKAGFYYIITMCTMAYILMVALAFLMDKFLKEQSKKIQTSSVNVKMMEMNKQISRNLTVQASLPFFIYLSVVFFLCIILLKIDVSRWKWLPYYSIFCSIPMVLPSALNPIVTICIIKNYRRVFITGIKIFVKSLKLLLFRQQLQSLPAAEEQWAARSNQIGTLDIKTVNGLNKHSNC